MFALTAAVGLAGLGAVVAAALAAAMRVDFTLPAVSELLAACERWVLPHGGLLSVLVLLAGSVGVAAVARMVRSAWRQVRDGRRFERALPVIGRAPDRSHARLLADDTPQAFCAGLVRPQVFVSTGAVALLSDRELEAVLAHEAHHRRRRDPLRLLAIRALADGLFFLPAVRRLGERCAALAELAADEAAEAAVGGRQAVASALLAFDRHPHPAAVGIAPERVDRLLGRGLGWELPLVTLAAGAVSLVAVGAVALRLLQATDHAAITLPVLLAQACMLAMAALPVLAGAWTVLRGRRLLGG